MESDSEELEIENVKKGAQKKRKVNEGNRAAEI